MRNKKKVMKKLPKIITALTMVFTMLVSYIAMPITTVIALTHGDGEKFITMGIDNELGFTFTATVNDNTWADHEDEFHTDNDRYHVVINVSGNAGTNDKVPDIQYGGNWNDYVTKSTQENNNNYTFVLDIDISTLEGEARQKNSFLALSIIEKQNNPEPNSNPNPNEGDNHNPSQDEPHEEHEEEHFDGKAYVIWSCGTGVCYHYFDNIPSFDDGNSTFYKNTEVTADNDNSITFDINAKYQGWAVKDKFLTWINSYKTKNNITGEIDWTHVDPEDIIGNNPPRMEEWEEKAISAGACTKPKTEDAPSRIAFQNCVDEYYLDESGELPFIKLQPVGEPADNNAYVSYGDRNFKVVIYNDKYKGITIGDLSDLNYYPAEWANPFIRQDQFDISGTTKEKPTYVNSILLEKTLNIKTLNYNGFEITKIEALDVPSDAVSISKVNGEWKLVFSSHFYDNVVFKATDNNGEVSYFAVKRSTVDAWINNIENVPHLYAELYYDRNNTYTDFNLTAKIIYKDGTITNVKLTHYNRVDDGLGNIAIVDEVDQEESEYGESGKGLKKAVFIYKLPNGKTDRDIKDAYINIEYKGSTETNYAGAFAGSGKGVLANIYHPEEEKE